MFSSSFLMKQFVTRIYCDGCSCVPHRESSGIRYCRNVFLRRVLPFFCFVFVLNYVDSHKPSSGDLSPLLAGGCCYARSLSRLKVVLAYLTMPRVTTLLYSLGIPAADASVSR